MTILGDVGGVMSIIYSVISFLLIPCRYQKHDLVVLKEFQRKNKVSNPIEIPNFASLRLMFFDLKNYFRRLGLFPKPKEGHVESM